MAFKDMVKNVANEAIQKTSESIKGGDFIQGLLDNYSEISPNQAYESYSCYLMNNEGIKQAFKTIRDVLIFTDKRIIFIDHTGVTGSKAKVLSINYFSIIEVVLETPSLAFDDSDLYFTYITTPNLRALNIEYATKHLEFPKNFPVRELYCELQELAYENCQRLHKV